MSVKVPPPGTRGPGGIPGPLKGLLFPIMRLQNRLMGSKLDGMPVIGLTTRGARSGKERTTHVMGFPEDDGSWMVVASYGGTAAHPAWFLNLARHPEDVWIETAGKRTRVTPRTLEGEELDRAWARITKQSPRFIEYRKKTDRELPVIRLTPAQS